MSFETEAIYLELTSIDITSSECPLYLCNSIGYLNPLYLNIMTQLSFEAVTIRSSINSQHIITLKWAFQAITSILSKFNILKYRYLILLHKWWICS